MKKRFALLIGAPHTGTTGLFRGLGSHPQVVPCRVMEPRYFTDARKFGLGLDWYRSLWEFQEPDQRVAIEASSDYAWHPHVECPAERIARSPAGFRFVYVVGDPLARIAAHHARDAAEGLTGPRLEPRELRRYVDATRYASQLERYRRHFPAEDFLLIDAADLARDPYAVLTRACRFLEIDPYFAFPDVRDQLVRAAAAARRQPGRLARWRERLHPTRAPRAASPPASLAPGVREAALRELRPEALRLAEAWGVDISGWRLE
jgi:hypothetical protein